MNAWWARRDLNPRPNRYEREKSPWMLAFRASRCAQSTSRCQQVLPNARQNIAQPVFDAGIMVSVSSRLLTNRKLVQSIAMSSPPWYRIIHTGLTSLEFKHAKGDTVYIQYDIRATLILTSEGYFFGNRKVIRFWVSPCFIVVCNNTAFGRFNGSLELSQRTDGWPQLLAWCCQGTHHHFVVGRMSRLCEDSFEHTEVT